MSRFLNIAAKRRCIEIGITQSFGEKLMMKGVGKKTGPFDYIEHPVPLFGGEFSEQESYL